MILLLKDNGSSFGCVFAVVNLLLSASPLQYTGCDT